MYYWQVTGELERAARTYELWQQTYPRDYLPDNELGILSLTLGNREKGLGEFREAVRLAPDNFWGYNNLGVAYMVFDRLDDAEAAWKEAEARRKGENEVLLLNRYGGGISEGRCGTDGAIRLSGHGQAGCGRLAAGHPGGYGRLVRKTEERARTDPAGDGFSPTQRQQRKGGGLSGGGSAA